MLKRIRIEGTIIIMLLATISGLRGQDINLNDWDLPRRIPVHLQEGQMSFQVCDARQDIDYQIFLLSEAGRHIPFTISERHAQDVNNYRLSYACATFQLEMEGIEFLYFSINPLEEIAEKTRRMEDGISVQNAPSDEYLIKDVLIAGNCFDVEGVNGIGNGGGRGTFTADSTVIEITEGVILASGSIQNALGPNSSSSTSTNFGGGSGDPDLSQLTSGSIFDAVGLEFDFTPTSEYVRFKYVFASEEYCEFTSTQFNDVFGFFLSGPGINGSFTNDAVNLAVIPGSSQYVAINNVNHNDFPQYYHDNTPIGQPQSQNLANCNFTSPPAAGINSVLDTVGWAVDKIEYDGFTTVFVAELNVIPCETYHIKLVVADVADGIYDSAVFLEAKSFDAGAEALLEAAVVQTGGTEVYENCYDAYFTVSRLPNSDRSQPLEVFLTVNPASTATVGVDLTDLPASVTIPPFQDQVVIPLNITDDGIPEGLETLLIETNFLCSCEFPYAEIQILDPVPIEVVLDSFEICEEESIVLWPEVSGGVPIQPYDYTWDNGSHSDNRLVFPTETTVYSLTVTDYCGNEGVGEAKVTVIPLPRAHIEGDFLLCPNDTETTVPITINAGGPYEILYSINGQEYWVDEWPVDNVIHIPITDTGTYELITIFGDHECFGQVTGSAHVAYRDYGVQIETEDVSCPGNTDGSARLFPIGFDANNIFIDWSIPVSGDSANGLPPGGYSVSITDTAGCGITDSFFIGIPDTIRANLQILENPDCVQNSGLIAAVVSGGDRNYSYEWSIPAPDTFQIGGLPQGSYYITVTDGKSCQSVDSIRLELGAPLITLIDKLDIDCNHTGLIKVGVSGGAPPYQTDWPLLGQDSMTAFVAEEGEYILEVTDSLGCTISDTFQIVDLIEYPIVDAGPDKRITCTQISVSLEASLVVTQNPVMIEWTSDEGNRILFPDSLSPTVIEAGTYIIHVLDSVNGCQSEDSVEVLLDAIIPNAEILSESELNCLVTEIALDASNSSSGQEIEFTWTSTDGHFVSGENTLLPLVDQAGTYILNVFNRENQCISTDSVIISENTLIPVADAGPGFTLSCTDLSVQLDGSGSDTGSSLQYIWTSSGGNILSGQDGLIPIVNSAGSYQLTVINTDNHCQSTDDVLISSNDSLPVANAGEGASLNCEITEVQLDGSASDQGSQYQYEWTTSNGQFISGEESLNPVVGAPGTYSLHIYNTENECRSNSSVTVLEDTETPSAEAGPERILDCRQLTVVLDGSGSASGPEYSYHWTTADGNILSGGLSTSPVVDQPGDYMLTVRDESNACEKSDYTLVTIDRDPPISDAGEDQQLDCRGNSVDLNGDNSSSGTNFSYHWTGLGGEQVADPTRQSTAANQVGLFQLTVLNELNGCTETDVVEVFQVPLETIDLTAFGISCLRDSGSVVIESVSGGTGMITYFLDPPGISFTSSSYAGLDPGLYTLTAEDEMGCQTQTTFSIEEEPELVLQLSGTVYVEYGQAVYLRGSVNVAEDKLTQISWTPEELLECPGCLETQAYPTETTEFTLEVTDVNGCHGLASIIVQVSLHPRVYIPNAFSPNQDEINDRFKPYANPVIVSIPEFQIFNRWGDKIFEQYQLSIHDPLLGWDGTFKEQLASEGVYVYWLTTQSIDGTIQFFKGNIHLLR